MANSSWLTKNRVLIEQVLLAIVIVLMVYLLYLQFRQNDAFQDDDSDCPCEPEGVDQLSAPECGENDGPVYEGGKVTKCGKLVKNGSARCGGVGISFDCKLN
jgi:hypothetical protein